MKKASCETPLNPGLASPGRWVAVSSQQKMHGGTLQPAFSVVTTGGAVEHYVGRVHSLDGRPEDLATVRMNARLFAASKAMAALLRELLEYEAEQFDGPQDLDLAVSGADTVDWLTDFRLRVRAVIEPGSGRGAR